MWVPRQNSNRDSPCGFSFGQTLCYPDWPVRLGKDETCPGIRYVDYPEIRIR